MWLLRSLKYMVVTPFHPIYGFAMAEEDVQSKRVRKFAFLGGILIYLIVYYFLLTRIPKDYSLPYWFQLGEFIFIRFFGIFGAFVMMIVIGLMFKDEVNNFARMLTSLVGMTMVLEIGFLVLSYYLPEYYFTIKAVTYIWRTTVVALGIYTMGDFEMKQAIILAIGCMIPLFFAHLDLYFNVI